MSDKEPYVTKTGKVLTDAKIEALSKEAEKGYCVIPIGRAPSTGNTRESRRRGGAIVCGRTLPCPMIEAGLSGRYAWVCTVRLEDLG